LKLISSDHNILEMVAKHVGVPVIELYIVSFDELMRNIRKMMIMVLQMVGIVGLIEMILIEMRCKN
jgi:hypothetical protein